MNLCYFFLVFCLVLKALYFLASCFAFSCCNHLRIPIARTQSFPNRSFSLVPSILTERRVQIKNGPTVAIFESGKNRVHRESEGLELPAVISLCVVGIRPHRNFQLRCRRMLFLVVSTDVHEYATGLPLGINNGSHFRLGNLVPWNKYSRKPLNTERANLFVFTDAHKSEICFSLGVNTSLSNFVNDELRKGIARIGFVDEAKPIMP